MHAASGIIQRKVGLAYDSVSHSVHFQVSGGLKYVDEPSASEEFTPLPTMARAMGFQCVPSSMLWFLELQARLLIVGSYSRKTEGPY